MPRGCKPTGEQAINYAEPKLVIARATKGSDPGRHPAAAPINRRSRPSAGMTQSKCYLLYSLNMLTDSLQSQIVCKKARQPKRSKPSSISIELPLLTLSCLAATGAVDHKTLRPDRWKNGIDPVVIGAGLDAH